MNSPSASLDVRTGLHPAQHERLARRRPEFVEGAIACRAAVLEPQEGLGLSAELRQALVRRVLLLSGAPQLAAFLAPAEDADLHRLSEGEVPQDPLLSTLARHADMIARDPARAEAADLARLEAAGLSVPQIVAISELLAYACYSVRIQHGFSLLEASA